MTSHLTIAALLLSAGVSFANSVPQLPPATVQHEVRLKKATPDYVYFVLRVMDEKVTLEPLKLSVEAWTILPTKVEGRKDSDVQVYCVPVAEVKRHATTAALLVAIKGGKARHSAADFGVLRQIDSRPGIVGFDGLPRTPGEDGRTRTVLEIFDGEGTLGGVHEDIETAPRPRRISRTMLLGVFTALSTTCAGLWFRRRK